MLDCCSTQCLARLALNFTDHQGLSDLFSEYLLPVVLCGTTETINSVKTSMDQSEFNAKFEGIITIKLIFVCLKIDP